MLARRAPPEANVVTCSPGAAEEGRPPTADGAVEGPAAERHAVVTGALEEVEREVRRRVEAGAVAPDEDRALDRAFRRLAPSPGSTGRLRSVTSLVADAAVIDPQVPVASQRPGGSMVKRLVRKAVGWYVRFFVAQIARFQGAVARAVAVLAEELEDLRARTQRAASPLPLPTAARREGPDRAPWWGRVALSSLTDAPGRVVHGDCGTGALLETLAGAGIDAYGTDPSAGPGGPDGPPREVLAVSLLEHLADMGDGTLGGVVAEGGVEVLPVAECEQLVAMAAQRLAPGGVLLVASASPAAWAASASPVLADLAPGRPLHPETWAFLMGHSGFDPVTVHQGGPDDTEYVVAGVLAAP
ncbi:MAG TPA: class I SAM-dependent methyltransferase [Acidimicrobiales bacterium]|nr:class I SAM-dependent methyltransferase [Acidimicrobiales bacterium]